MIFPAPAPDDTDGAAGPGSDTTNPSTSGTQQSCFSSLHGTGIATVHYFGRRARRLC